MTADRLLSIGRSWLGRFTSPSVAMTPLRPIHSGTPAATSVPNVIRSRIRVTGSESRPALVRSSAIVSLTAWVALLRRRDRGEHRIDPVAGLGGVARHLEVHQGRVAVLGDRALALERRLH